ncbi:hypothetical protein GIB67_001868 [Kingdonia uniflora]|uniref:Uncharacterized protein n=1 Tax=Kingdonia uniflora TaxID=39325 RepID=A0A7J7LQF0_9MAGN|nr:hypothetical protein GIB67_001868 [Kingdonia uniflora]
MEFTEAYKQIGPCCFLPNARYLAVAVDYRLVIRDVLSLKVVQLFIAWIKLAILNGLSILNTYYMVLIISP